MFLATLPQGSFRRTDLSTEFRKIERFIDMLFSKLPRGGLLPVPFLDGWLRRIQPAQ
jgi:hypothetical protein